MNLAEILLGHPREISALEIEVLKTDRQLSELQLKLTKIDLEIDQSVYFDKDLKNESQREVRRTETRLGHQEWEQLTTKIDQLKKEKIGLRIQIDELTRIYNGALAIQKSLVPVNV